MEQIDELLCHTIQWTVRFSREVNPSSKIDSGRTNAHPPKITIPLLFVDRSEGRPLPTISGRASHGKRRRFRAGSLLETAFSCVD